MGRQMTTDEFVAKAREVHGDRYDYSLVEYTRAKVPVTIICPIHGEFRQTPDVHNRGCGCVKCRDNVYDLKSFIVAARKVHGDRFDYSLSTYSGIYGLVRIICPEHGEFLQRADTHAAGKNGCKQCLCKMHDLVSFIAQSREVHGDTYDYSRVVYVSSKIPVTIVCRTHGGFEQAPGNHVHLKQGCSRCATAVHDSESFVVAARKVHGTKYDYALVEYVLAKTPVTIICPVHGEFKQAPTDHVTGASGCPKCAEFGFNPMKPAVLYVYLMQSDTLRCIGFGITNRFKGRHLRHTRNAARVGISLNILHVFSFEDGSRALDKEREIKSSIKIVDAGMEGFRTEAANESSLPEILRILNAA